MHIGCIPGRTHIMFFLALAGIFPVTAADPGVDLSYSRANSELAIALDEAGEDEPAQKLVFASHAAKLFDLSQKYSGEVADQALIESAVFFAMGGDAKASDNSMKAALKRAKTWKLQLMALDAACSIPGREMSAQKLAAALIPAARTSSTKRDDLMPFLQRLKMIKEMGDLRAPSNDQFAPSIGAGGDDEEAAEEEEDDSEPSPKTSAKGKGDDGRKGPKLPDFAARSFQDGTSFSLSDYRGKVVIIDFWATWCGPCMEELPRVAELYEKYHDDGLEIIGISLDSDLGTLRRFLDESKIGWVQVCDGAAWKTTLAVKFGVKSIPSAFVVGRDGTLLAAGVRAHDLEKILPTVMGE